jgi:hypothetical protein
MFTLLLFLMLDWQEAPIIRPNIETGFGELIDDLERHAQAGHPMRNKKDPGNWVHELTHQINSNLRKDGKNCFYVFGGKYISLKEPNITLSQIKVKVKGPLYQLYLVNQRRYFEHQPLYILDEATASTNALQYCIENKIKDNHREKCALEFIEYSKDLLRTVQELDPDYEDMEALKAYVEWNEERVQRLLGTENGVKIKLY